jgi:hypothetical protein
VLQSVQVALVMGVADDMTPALAGMLGDLAYVSSVIAYVPMAVMLAAVAVVSLRSGVLPPGWAGFALAQAAAAWRLVEDELVQVTVDGRSAWLLQRDLRQFMSPTMVAGVRFLPPQDSYLLLRDRTTLIPNRALHRHLWRASGNPGGVLLDGQVVASWRPRKQGKRLGLPIELFRDVPPSGRDQIAAEAATLAPFKDCITVEIAFAEAS